MHFLYILFSYSLPKYYIRSLGTNKMMARHEGEVIISDFYSPIVVKFKQSNDGDLYFIDTIVNKAFQYENKKIVLKFMQNAASQAFGLVYNSETGFYIMKNNKCLEAEPANPLFPNITKVKFASCAKEERQLWEILFSGDKKINLRHVYIPDSKKHLQRHNHLFYDKRNPNIKKHSSYMIYHPKKKGRDRKTNHHNITLKVSENYQASIF
ncbi:hypothetical protein P3W45_000990 [Vairimorpha bombi]